MLPKKSNTLNFRRLSFYYNIRALLLGGSIAYGFWYVIYHARQFNATVLITLLVIITGTIWTSRTSLTKKYRLNYLILPILLFVSGLFFFLLLKNPTFQILFVLMIGAIYTFLFRVFAELREKPSPERKKTITQTLDIVSIVVVFLSFASLEQLFFFFSLKIYWLLLLGLILTVILLYQIFWYHRLITFRAWFFIFLGGMLITQILSAVVFLPTGYLTNAITVVAAFYVYQAITVSALRRLLRRRLVLEYVGVAAVLLLIAFLGGPLTPLR